MLYSGTDPESYITEYTSVYEDHRGLGKRVKKKMNTFKQYGAQPAKSQDCCCIKLLPDTSVNHIRLYKIR